MQERLDPKIAFEFLLTEVQSGLLFAQLAAEAETKNDDKMERNVKNARTAYDTILRLRDRVVLPGAAVAKLDAEVHRLKIALHKLGERV